MSLVTDTLEGDLHYWAARSLAAAIRRREVSAVDVMRAHLARIEALNPQIKAVVSMIQPSEALRLADEADRSVARGDVLGPLHGLPTAVKDLMDVAGLPTSHGGSAHRGATIATTDSLIARRLRQAGAIIIGKTNTPEHGLGALTFNDVFGVTVNPFDPSRHAGGSSGGAAAALASGMLPIADGSDSGGSLRYPAAFCNVVGLRTTPGRIASGRSGDGWSPHAVLGPMARDSDDAILLLSALSGPHPRAPLSHLTGAGGPGPVPPVDPSTIRVAWSTDLGGLPVSTDIRDACRRARDELVSLGFRVEEVEPDLAGADACWETIETFEFLAHGRDQLARDAGHVRLDYRRNVLQGAELTAAQLADALDRRTELFRTMAAFLQDYDVLITPATPVVAPPSDVEWVSDIDGVQFDRYFQWQMMANRITVTGHPAMVTSGGFTPQGLPTGLQIVGAYGADARLLSIGAAIETCTEWIRQRPLFSA